LNNVRILIKTIIFLFAVNARAFLAGGAENRTEMGFR